MTDEADDDKARWVSDPFTRQMLKGAERERAKAIENLINGCRVTTDVRVMELYSKYALYDGLLGFLKGEK